MWVFDVLFVRLGIVVVWAITTPTGRDGDGTGLPSGGGHRPTPRNFTTPNAFLFLLIRASLPSFVRSDTSFGRIS